MIQHLEQSRRLLVVVAPKKNESNGQIDGREDPPLPGLDRSRIAIAVVVGNRIHPRRRVGSVNDTLDEVDAGEVDGSRNVNAAGGRLSATLKGS